MESFLFASKDRLYRVHTVTYIHTRSTYMREREYMVYITSSTDFTIYKPDVGSSSMVNIKHIITLHFMSLRRLPVPLSHKGPVHTASRYSWLRNLEVLCGLIFHWSLYGFIETYVYFECPRSWARLGLHFMHRKIKAL